MLAYCQLLGPGVFAVFYYAGHGFEENGKNYLMPIDATTTKGDEFIQAQEILTVRIVFFFRALAFLLLLLFLSFKLFATLFSW